MCASYRCACLSAVIQVLYAQLAGRPCDEFASWTVSGVSEGFGVEGVRTLLSCPVSHCGTLHLWLNLLFRYCQSVQLVKDENP